MPEFPTTADQPAEISAGQAPRILRLTIERFRGIENLIWYPESGVNLILGGGDVGKTTVLDAIALLFNPTNTGIVSDADYYRREIENGFSIEAVMFLPEKSGINQQTKNAWPWEWDGKDIKLPSVDEDPATEHDVAHPAYCVRVRGTPDMDLTFEVVQPDSTPEHFSVSVRRKIGLVRLGGDDRNDRDLRLIQGSALDRLLSDKTLRARLGQKLDQSDIAEELNDNAKTGLTNLDTAFQDRDLPTGLSLGLIGGQGFSVNALVGLTATKDMVKLPLTSWGAGTRRLAALEIADAHQGDNPITLVDEVERGLEPYRQRLLMGELQNNGSQVFVTTHSPTALSAASSATIWQMDTAGAIGRLPDSIRVHLRRDPEAFLARLTIITEGPTEFGFVEQLLRKTLPQDRLDYGIWITSGDGNDYALQMLQDLAKSGLRFAGFADDEGRSPNRWASVQSELGNLLFRWPSGCIEQNILSLVPFDRLEDFIRDPDGESGPRLRTLADRLEIQDKQFSDIKSTAPDLRSLIVEAATGVVPKDKESADKSEKKAMKKHSAVWFKSVEGGQELATKAFEFNLWPQLEPQLLPFLNAIRQAVKLPSIDTLLS